MPELVIAVAISLASLWLLLLVVLWVLRPRGVPARDVLGVVPDVLRLGRDLLRDPGTPLSVRLALGLCVAWILNPVDLVPEFVPVIGPLDDLVVAVLVLRYARRRLGVDSLAQRWRGTPDGWRLLRRLIG